MVHKNDAAGNKIGLGGLMAAMERRGIKTDGMDDDKTTRPTSGYVEVRPGVLENTEGGKQYADARTILTAHEGHGGYKVKQHNTAADLVAAIKSGETL